MTKYPTQASVYLTRNCNLSCTYCTLSKHTVKELDIHLWFEVFKILDTIGVRNLNMLGGEPTLYNGLAKLVRYLNDRTSLEYVLISNSCFSETLLNELVNNGIRAYIASIDEIVLASHAGDDALLKSFAGLRVLRALKKRGVKFLGANVVIHRNNIRKVIPTVKYLIQRDFYINVCPIIWGRENHWERRQKDNTLSLTEEHFPILKEISEFLLEVKHCSGLIIPSESYLIGLPRFSIKMDWKCYNGIEKLPPRLRVDSDGALMSCPDFRGNVSYKYDVWDLVDIEKTSSFFRDWYEDVKNCPGCYWSSMYRGKENLPKD